MGGLIEGAKKKIWSIANEMISAKPTPELRIALVGYRDRGDDYVVKTTKLTDDIDTVYADLMKFEAGGGGDEPESVNEALRTAVRDVAWSDDKDVLKILFLVGDAPPHMDYDQDTKYPDLCEEAVKKDLIINTVQCGSIAATTPIWKEIARKSEGEFAALEQSGNMATIDTPMDGKLEELNRALGDTMIAYGNDAVRREVATKQAAAVAAPAAASAERLKYNIATGKVVQGEGELVDSISAGTTTVSELKKDELPADLRGLSNEELEAEIKKRSAKRTELQRQIAEISRERDDYIEKEKRASGNRGDSFDDKVAETIRKQAKSKGLNYE
jgi:Skp family chaperone for outer membrane proteins